MARSAIVLPRLCISNSRKRCDWLKSLSRLRSGDFRTLPSLPTIRSLVYIPARLRCAETVKVRVSSLSHKAGSKFIGLCSSHKISNNWPGAIRILSVSCVRSIRLMYSRMLKRRAAPAAEQENTV